MAKDLPSADEAKAQLIIEYAKDAIDLFGKGNQEEKVELRLIIEQAERTVSPDSIDTLKKRAEKVVLRLIYPRKPILRNILLLGIGSFLIAGLFWEPIRSFQQSVGQWWNSSKIPELLEPPFSNIQVVKVTSNGKATSASISPDGKFVAHVSGPIERQSIRLRPIETVGDTEIVPSNGKQITNLTFSPDGAHLYFERIESDLNVLEEVSVLGGPPKIVVRDIDSGVTFSPDSKKLAFVRGYPDSAEASLIVANVDGSGELKLVTHAFDDFFRPMTGTPAWSPDGQRIAVARRDSTTNSPYANITIVHLNDGREQQLTNEKWISIQAICWLPNSQWLLFTAIDSARRNAQIWRASYPKGEVGQITHDPNNYEDISITSDGLKAATILSEGNSDIWVAPNENLDDASQITDNRFDGVAGIAWTADDKIVHVCNKSGTRDIWLMNADGTDDKQLTIGSGLNILPSISADGRYIIFQSNRAGPFDLWRIDIDGRNAQQLTYSTGKDVLNPYVTLDDQVIYSSSAGGFNSVWKIPISGGAPVKLTKYPAGTIGTTSPKDGRMVVIFFDDRVDPPRWRVGVIAPDNDIVQKAFDFPDFGGTVGGGFYSQLISWTLDGKALTYIDTKDGVSNIWAQPLDGGRKRQLTHFKSELIFKYAWSHAGKLALARGSKTSDVMLILDIGKKR